MKNRADSIEETARLLAFNEHKLYRTIVRRRICVRQISLPFSKSYQRVEVYRHAESAILLGGAFLTIILKKYCFFAFSIWKTPNFSFFRKIKRKNTFFVEQDNRNECREVC